MSDPVALIRELAETVHQTDSLRNHADPNDKTGWNLHGIETCADPLCVEALAFLAAPRSVETAGLDVEPKGLACPACGMSALYCGLGYGSTLGGGVHRCCRNCDHPAALSPDTTETP